MWQLVTLASIATLFGGVTIIFLGSSDFPLSPELMKLRYELVAGAAFAIALMSRFRSPGITSTGIRVLVLWSGFALSMVVSGIITRDTTAVRDGFWYLFGIPALCFAFLPALMGRAACWLTAWGLLLGNAPFLIVSLLVEPINGSLYRGVFANPNQMGVTCAIMSAAAASLLSGAMASRKSFFVIAGWTVVLLSLGGLLLVSNSRTSLITWAVVMLVFLKGAFNYTRALAQSVAVAGVLIAAAVAARYEQIRFAVLEIADTYEQKSDVGGLNGREEIWGQAWDDACAFGYGSDYFQSRFELGGHNTIIDLLARLGYVTAGLAITVCLVTVLEAMRFWKQQTEDPYALLPALVVVCFWTLSMAEGMFGSLGNTVTMAFLVSTGIIVSSKRQVLATNSLVAAVTRNATAPRRRLDPGNSLSPGVSRRAVSARGRT